MKRTLLVALLSLCCATGHAADASSPSQAVGAVSGTVVVGSIVAVALTGSAVVTATNAAGDGIDILLKNASDGSTATVRLSGKAAQGLSLAAGTVVNVTATSTGHLLVASGKAIAFIPNEIGRALLHSRKAGA